MKRFENDPEAQIIGATEGRYASSTGGDVYGLKYTGLLNDDMSLEIVTGLYY